jgi:sugar phosphate isomerase/epimerase
MIQSTNPATVDFEMDMYWTVAAGVDPIAYMKKFPNRFKLVHVKDMAKTAKGHESCVVGKGIIDYKNILPQAHQQGVNYFIVEQEEYTGTNELDAAKADASYLKTLNW